MPMINRRGFMRLLGIGAGAAAVAPSLLVPDRDAIELVEAEPVRRYWQVGADIRRPQLSTADEALKARYSAFVAPGGTPDDFLKHFRPYMDQVGRAQWEAEIGRYREIRLLYGDGYTHDNTTTAFTLGRG